MTTTETQIATLRFWGQTLLWVSVALPILGAIAAGARYYVERREKQLSSSITSAAISDAQTKAAHAQEQLVELKEKAAPRALSPEQRTEIASVLATLKGSSLAVAARMMDGESYDYARQFQEVFRSVGIVTTTEPITTSLNDLTGYVAIAVPDGADPQVARIVEQALRTAGIKAWTETIKTESMGMWYPKIVHVIVGRKQP